jgi:hypothetical protein
MNKYYTLKILWSRTRDPILGRTILSLSLVSIVPGTLFPKWFFLTYYQKNLLRIYSFSFFLDFRVRQMCSNLNYVILGINSLNFPYLKNGENNT